MAKRIKFKPLEVGKDYWLGYQNPQGGFMSLRSTYGVYFGVWNGRHLFLDVFDGKLEVYSCPEKECFVTWFSDGEDDPCISAPDVSHERAARSGLETNVAIAGVLQVREAAKRRAEEQRKALIGVA